MKLMQFLMSLDDCYQPARSSLLTKDHLLKVKNAYNVAFKEESHIGVFESSNVTVSKMNAFSLAAKSLTMMKKLLSLINETPSASIHANMAGKASFFNGNVCQMLQSPNDDGKDTSVENDSMQPFFDTADYAQGVYQEGWHSGTQVDDQNWYESNVHKNNPFPTQMVDSFDDDVPGLRRNNNWTECDLTHGRKPIGCQWIWKIKYKASGEVERYKARLVAKGFSQRECFDYDETFSLVVKMVTVRCLISITMCNSWSLYQLDVNNAFLYSDLKEDVYMSLLKAYGSNNKNKLCKLNKSLYDLKQAPRQWNAKLTTALIEDGFKQSKFDYSLYVKQKGSMFVA
nr:ribonuclease H-like domain-containing protein [Tanacetum cinerariifolium]